MHFFFIFISFVVFFSRISIKNITDHNSSNKLSCFLRYSAEIVSCALLCVISLSSFPWDLIPQILLIFTKSNKILSKYLHISKKSTTFA